MAEGQRWKVLGLPRLALGYVLAVDGLAVAVALVGAADPSATGAEWVPAGVLMACAALHLRLSTSVERLRRDQVTGPHMDLCGVWTLAGALLLPAAQAATLVVLTYAYRWWLVGRFDDHRPPHRAVFSAATILLSALAVAALVTETGLRARLSGDEALGPSDAVVLAAAFAVSWTVNTVLVAVAILLTTRLDHAWAAFGGRQENLLELGQLVLGLFVVLAMVRWPGFALLMVVPVVALHRTMLFQQLQQEARTDDKTGLLKASVWRQHVQGALRLAADRQVSLAVFMIDLDRFSEVNNRYGHLAGDAVLQRVATLLTSAIRRDDVVARFGGEEFAVLMPSVGRDEALVVAERIRDRMHELCVVTGDATISGLTVSIGVALHPDLEADSVDALLAAADEALYKAKRGGRDQVRLAGEHRTLRQ